MSILEKINKIHKFFLNQNVFISTTKNAKFGVFNQLAHFLVANVEKKTFSGFSNLFAVLSLKELEKLGKLCFQKREKNRIH